VTSGASAAPKAARTTRHVGSIAAALVLPAVWFVLHARDLVHDPGAVALASGGAIFGASFLLSWVSEAAQLDIPQALALAVLALIAVLPEYAVDVYFAWRAGQDPSYTSYAAANMTGSNRLLLGVGWAAPVLVVWARTGRREVALPRDQAVEVNFLALATLYSFVIPLKGTLSLVDSVILFVIFVAYLRAAGRTHHGEPEIEGPAEALVRLGPTGRRVGVLALAAVAGAAILTAAEPFAESLIATGRRLGIEEFLLVQWLAPLASEAPEFIVAILFAMKGAAAAGIGTMVSSKVNQWTLLVGALPAAFALSHGSLTPMHLDMRQREEIFLTSAQSVLGLVAIANFRFAVPEAVALFVLFAVQLVFTSPTARWLYAAAYLLIAAAIVVWSPDVRQSVRSLFPQRPRRHA
jgi:cation:H+ antiporter